MDVRVSDQAAASAEKSTSDRSFLQIHPALRLAVKAASRLSPALGAAMAGQLFFRPPRAPYRPEQEEMLALAQAAVIEVRNRPVRAYCWGEGPAVLLLHGWGGHAGQMTEFAPPLARAGYRAVALDAPAHGRSGGRLSSVVHFADAINAAAATFGPFHAVIAHSMGATATVHQLGKALKVKRLVFIAPQARITGYFQLFRDRLGLSDGVWDITQARSERWLNVRYDQLHPVDHASRMATPLLVLHGERDRLVPPGEGEMLARLWPGATFHALDSGHLAILRDWRALLAAVEFVKGR